MNQYSFSEAEWEACIKVLTALKESPFDNPDNQLFKTLITSIHKKAKKDIRKADYEQKREEDFDKIASTTIISNAQENTTLYTHEPTPKDIRKAEYIASKIEDFESISKTTIISNAQKNTTFYQHEDENMEAFSPLHHAQSCYSCNKPYSLLHFFYHKLCPDCARFNYAQRQREPDFKDYQVILTGGRVKIGYATALKFLRAEANVVVTTRFPALALEQFSREDDFDNWKDRLTLYGLDLRNIKAVYGFVDFCKNTLSHVDILINNAAQTIKYPLDYYQPLIQREQQNLLSFHASKLIDNTTPIGLKQEYLLDAASLSDFKVNRFGQPIDNRVVNSWNSKLEEIGLEELLEVNFINHISPYILIAELDSLIAKSSHKERFIVNVTSSEGQFSYANKTIYHPHTNMTKAALNMLTRTSAADYVKKGIYMNAVDVGWISTGANEEKRSRLFEKHSIPPLDSVDGAMRIIHPILEIQQGNIALFGKLLKNYQEVDW
jgi:NAD(P)-dependent dehydrogenase (short-subunit alcohol dehydrogenase family)